MFTMQHVWVALAASLMLTWLALAVIGPRKIDAAKALAVLRYGAALRTLALVIALVVPMVMMYMVWVVLWRSDNMRNVFGISMLALCIIAGLPVIEMTRVQVVVTDEGLTRHSPWSSLVTLNWIEIEHVSYSFANRWFIVTGAGKTMRVSRHLAGIGAFVAALRHRVAKERWAGAAAVFDVIAS